MKSIFLFTILLYFVTHALALPLSTDSKWIVDAKTGQRVKLTCANWPGHILPMLPEGLNKRPAHEIARHISLMGFNCVRLTYATNMYVHHANLTVEQSFKAINLTEEEAGVAENNPALMGLTLLDAQKAVIDELARHGVMTVIDNHVSKPIWCCGDDDGNGFWGDKYFNPEEWLRAWHMVADRYKDTPWVVGMSLRNEIRGPKQNESVWYEYIEAGAKTIHKANPNVLIIVSGLHYDQTFTQLKTRPLNVRLDKKLVYELHHYSMSNGESHHWGKDPFNKMCDGIIDAMHDQATFLREGDHPTPIFFSEFGTDQWGADHAGVLFMPCLLKFLAENDLDWAIWGLQGSYYFRDGKRDMDEGYGMLDRNWTNLRNPDFHSRLLLLQQMQQDPRSKKPSNYQLFHPVSGKCLSANLKSQEVYGADCRGMTRWSHGGDGTPIRLVGTKFCLKAVEEGMPVGLTTDCSSMENTWSLALNSRYQFVSQDKCLDWDPNYSAKILTRKCIGVGVGLFDVTENPNPEQQWFSLVPNNV